ncbi:class I adenylate-forming enzyme family protein [Paenibacillus tuaregi]|uniref:class I adenylate-forming enzyme family protein n=1 Tax=Paenibacillus tuaregi TaxID=1816681 RepID=UPI000B1A04C1|nr:AMP-binding protein [Paenibacillus tuaregi]
MDTYMRQSGENPDLNLNVVSYILRQAADRPGLAALSHSQGNLTYSDLAERIKRIAQGLKQAGINRDKVAILSTNRVEFVEVFLGTIYAGCVPVPLDPKWSSREVHAVLHQCKPGIIFTEASLADRLNILKSESIVLTFSADHAGTGSYDSWLARFTPETEMEPANELLFIGFTSGTTGLPKGFMRSHASWISSFRATEEAFRLSRMEHITAPGPFVHSLSLFALMQSLYSGATFHIVPQFEADEVLRLCERVPDMILFVVPTMIEAMLRLAKSGSTNIQAIISSGGKWTEASKEACKKVFCEARLYEYYGSSEASYISYMDVYDDIKPGAVGRAFPGVEVSIRDEQFSEVPIGVVGQLYIRSPMMFLGYYQRPEETAAVFRDGWLELGDYASLDEDGYLHLAGRSKNRMITGGLNVFPEEVEAVLQQLPDIQEVMVLGVPDDYWGEKITALVKWRGEGRLSLEEIKSYCRRYLAAYKAPRQIITVDEFTYTSSGKISRYVMKQMVKG